MEFGAILEGTSSVTEDVTAEPLKKEAATAIPSNAATQGIIIP